MSDHAFRRIVWLMGLSWCLAVWAGVYLVLVGG
jgi:hypothetical protein